MSQYLDLEGVKALWDKVKAKATSATAAAKNYTDQEIIKITDGTYTAKKAASATSADSATNVTTNINGKAITDIFETDGVTVKKATSANSAANATHANSANTATTASVASKASKDGDGNVISSTYVKSSLLGRARGVATLDETGQVPASQLPSFVDDVIEGYLYNGKFYKESAHTTAITGEGGKIYVDLGNKKTYRWSGSAFVEISASIAIGETTGTAFDGKRGKDLEKAYSSLNTNLSKKLNITGTSDPDTSGYITKVDFTREGLGGSQFNGVIHSVTTNNKNANPEASIVESYVEVGMGGVEMYCSEYISREKTYGLKVTPEGVKNFYDDGNEYDVIDASMAIPVSVITALA